MRPIRLFLALLVLSWSAAASAEVEVHFYSKDFASTFPHAFVRLTGTVDSTGAQIDNNYGFTPVSLTPAILFGPVHGMIQSVSPEYVARSDRHFTLKLTEEQYRTVLDVVARWYTEPQPNYRLNSRNCIHFVADVATALGLHAPPVPKLMKKPKSFLRKVTSDNAALIQQWANRFAVAAKPAPAAATPQQ